LSCKSQSEQSIGLKKITTLSPSEKILKGFFLVKDIICCVLHSKENTHPKSHLTIKFNARAGGEYIFDCNFDCSGEWGTWIIDKHTGYIVND